MKSSTATSSGFDAVPSHAAPSLVQNRPASIKLPDEWELMEMERRAANLVIGHHETIDHTCYCDSCRAYRDLTRLIDLVRKLRAVA